MKKRNGKFARDMYKWGREKEEIRVLNCDNMGLSRWLSG